jgi:hypothetical protein
MSVRFTGVAEHAEWVAAEHRADLAGMVDDGGRPARDRP